MRGRTGVSGRKLIVIVVNRLVLSDLDNPSLPTISRMLHSGSIGLISPNCVGVKNEAGVMLTASAGTSCRGAGAIGEFYDSDEKTVDGTLAGDAYAMRTGRRAAHGSAVLLGLGPVLRANADLKNSGAKLGALGDALRRAGKRTCAIDNADRIPDIRDRSAAVLAMDARGLVECGHVAGAPVKWYTGPAARTTFVESLFFGTDPNWLSAKGPFIESSDFVVLDYGDIVRLDDYKLSMSDEAYAARRRSVLRDLDTMLKSLIDSRRFEGAQFVLVSFSPSANESWDYLTPIVVYPAAKPGLLASTTTRTPGLIAASDFAPTMLKLMGAPEDGRMVGRAAEEVRSAGAMETVRDMDARVTANKRLLLPVAVFFVVVAVLPFTAAAVLIAFRRRVSRRLLGVLRVGVASLACAPVSMMLGAAAPAGNAGYVIGTAASWLGLVAICTAVGAVWSRRTSIRALPVVMGFAATVLIIIVDAFSGCNLCKFAAPSSYQLSGFRFYGVGNEYAGFLISMAAIVALFVAGRARSSSSDKWFAGALGVITLLVLGAGNLGANYGATAAAVVTAGLAAMGIFREGFRARHVAAVFALGIVLVAAFAIVDWRTLGEAGTHGGRLTGMFESVGPGYVVGIALRKVLMNLAITTGSTSTRVILAFSPFMVLWMSRIRPVVSDVFRDEPRMIAGLKGLAVGSVVAYLLNDSGIVIASIMVAMTVLILLYSLLEEPQAWGDRASSREEAAACQGS